MSRQSSARPRSSGVRRGPMGEPGGGTERAKDFRSTVRTLLQYLRALSLAADAGDWFDDYQHTVCDR